MWLPSQKHHPAAVTGLLSVSPCSLCWAPTLQLVPLLLGPECCPLCLSDSRGQILLLTPFQRVGYGNRLAFHFHPQSLFSDFGRKSTIYWSLVHNAYSILQGGLSASASQGLLYAGTVIECRVALPPCHQDFCFG